MALDPENKQSRWQRWKDKMQDTYRFVIINDETFQEVSSYRLTLLNLWVLISTVLVVVTALVVSLIIFTPLKTYIPGYSMNYVEKVYELNKQVTTLQEELDANRMYTERVRKILVGDYQEDFEMQEKESLETPVNNTDPNHVEEVEPIEVDRTFREDVSFDEIGQIAQNNNETSVNFSPKDIPLERVIFNSPVRGTISAGFSVEDEHYGVDILAPKNTAIKAALDGYIFFSDWTLKTGNTIAIQHGNNTITVYKHNSALLKELGDYVKAGEAVSIIGNTGTQSDGPHLHFELWNEGKPVDPSEYIRF